MTLTLERQPLGQLLVGRGVIGPAQLERALAEQRRSGHQKLLGEILVELRDCTHEEVGEALALSYGVPFARVSPAVADPRALAVLPVEFCREHLVLPLFVVRDVLTLAMAEPANPFMVEEVERRTGTTVQIVAATAADIRATLGRYRPERQAYAGADDAAGAEGLAALDRAGAEVERIGISEEDAPAVRLVGECLRSALRAGARDVHFEPGEGAFRVRFRIDGRLIERHRPPHRLHAPLAARLKAMAGLDVAEQRLPQEGAGRVEIDGRTIDLRVHTMPGPHGERLVARLVDGPRATPDPETLGFSYDALKQWEKLIARPQGLVLVTGPAGSGKRTTLYSALRARAADDLNVCTIEDPVAGAIPHVNQFEVNEGAGLTFAAGLRAMLRQDPDVILVGDVRDAETAQLAARAALSRQLVFASLHTPDAPSAIPRMLHLGVEPYVLASTLAGALGQRLVRRLCQACKEPHVPAGGERRRVERLVGAADPLFAPRGCARCRNVGYLGRLGVFELLVSDDALADAIGRAAPPAELRRLAQQAGYKPLRADAIEKAQAGITSLAEVLRVT
jgi:type IV pilus assembly protein PilB